MSDLSQLGRRAVCLLACAAALIAGAACGDAGGASGGAGAPSTAAGTSAGSGGHGGAGDLDGGMPPGSSPCDLSGTWVAQHNTRNTALSADQLATNWNYHRIEQDGDSFRIVASLDCGYVVRGTTDVSLPDATLEAMAKFSSNGVGVEGTSAPTADGKCALAFDRIYTIRGADRARFLDAVWQVGDPPKDVDDFEMPTNAAEGMEDWDADGHEGLTQLTGFGDRYTAQVDWHAFHGEVPQASAQFGGEGVISVDYDAREVVSLETDVLLRASSVPMSPGYGLLARVDDALEVIEDGEHPELQTCKNVQALAIEKFGDPPAP